ncbi:hypothetical protein BABINDRAFT_162972 [Babjeviella inositovora NRRL Y-12698]|uniref:LicD/FKTN/FKRP nucleotidyltransferase domain-containing protein n=1 Tax=Babjeviella inositovora NRRL Y-12698 TaxID=984486 RepID=A0A1E3QMW2_9ASCO|nr:uncharacterized protein BABINDRAFT_162972 [Babjeviella inositovora NRRL Y-12698]ODQ78337.1 hypothetical protein BABINDRAFT_162972 [Babjeviella inositovora NRRL Y-12698]
MLSLPRSPVSAYDECRSPSLRSIYSSLAISPTTMYERRHCLLKKAPSIFNLSRKISKVKRSGWTLLFAIAAIALCFQSHWTELWFGARAQDSISAKDLEDLGTVSPGVKSFVSRSFFPSSMVEYLIPRRDLQVYSSTAYYQHFSMDYDPRLAPSLWLNVFGHSYSGKINPRFKLPFSWSSWVDFDSGIESAVNQVEHKLTCGAFKRLYKIDHELTRCEDKRGKKMAKFVGYQTESLSGEARRYIGSSYMKFSAPPPERVMFLGVILEGALIIPVDKTRSPSNGDLFDLAELSGLYIQNEMARSGLSAFDVIKEGVSHKRQVAMVSRKVSGGFEDTAGIGAPENITTDITRIVSHETTEAADLVHLTKNEFFWDTNAKLTELKVEAGELDLDMRLLCAMERELAIAPNFTKYFHEAPISGKPGGGHHFDWRFFKSAQLSDYERQAALHRMTRAWLRFVETAGLRSWLAHGTLLGWYWNGLNMPWDGDVDVQITMESLYKLAREYNQTLVVDYTSTKGEDSTMALNAAVGSYLIDVGPSFFSRLRTNGENTIDARFIDTATGLYVDITALAFTDASQPDGAMTKANRRELNALLDENFSGREATLRNDPAYQNRLSSVHSELFSRQELFNCRNNHFYALSELSPLVPTLFEGVRSVIPRQFEPMLKREYKRGLTNLEFDEYQFKPVYRLWIPKTVCPNDRTGGEECGKRIASRRTNRDTKVELMITGAYVENHYREKEIMRMKQSFVGYRKVDEFPCFRVDPWVIKRTKKAIELLDKG